MTLEKNRKNLTGYRAGEGAFPKHLQFKRAMASHFIEKKARNSLMARKALYFKCLWFGD